MVNIASNVILRQYKINSFNCKLSSAYLPHFLKGALSGLRQLLPTEIPLKLWKIFLILP